MSVPRAENMAIKYKAIIYSDAASQISGGLHATVTEAAQHLEKAGDTVVRWEDGVERELNEAERLELNAFFRQKPPKSAA